jgi:TolB-like protein
MHLIDELKRRNVFRVGAAYVLLGWVVVQVTDTISPALNLPDWTLPFVTWLGIIGFPFALFFAWAYELTPDGIRREADISQDESVTKSTGQKLDIVLIVLLVITIGLIAWDRFSGTPEKAITVEEATPDAVVTDVIKLSADSVAVLPLVNMSAATDNAFFAGGVHEEILTNLSRIGGLRVISRTTVMRYINSGLSVGDIGRELDARYIVEGSVRRIGNHVRVTVQLIDAFDDAHLWANNYDRELVDVFATQSEVAREITNSLHLEIKPESVGTLDDMPTRSVKAYDLYLKAKSIERSEYESESTLRRQRELLEAAVAEDPAFVEAWAYLNEVLDNSARTIIQEDWFGETKAERDTSFAEIRQTAERALEKAVALDPDNIETLLAQASDFVSEQNSSGFRAKRKQYIDRVIELEPDNAFAWYVLGWWYRAEGILQMAASSFIKALELDPFHAHIVRGSLIYFRLDGNEEMTARLFERLAEIAPEKRDDETLTKIPTFQRFQNLMYQFSATADESIIETYELEFANSVGKFNTELEEKLSLLRLLQYQNNLAATIAVDAGALPETSSLHELNLYFIVNDMLLSAQRVAGKSDDALSTALRIVDARERVPAFLGTGDNIATIDQFALAAHVMLDEEDRVQELLKSQLNESSDLNDNFLTSAYVALSHVDLDRAVELALAQKASRPGWHGTDMIAAFPIWARHMVIHPDMQRFYVNEGKWLDYLAERVPEYAKYKP